MRFAPVGRPPARLLQSRFEVLCFVCAVLAPHRFIIRASAKKQMRHALVKQFFTNHASL